MAITVLTNAFISINGVNLSDHVSKVTCEDTRDQVDITAMGATNKAYTKGLGDGKVTVDFFQDFAASKVHSTVQPLLGSTTGITVEVRADSAARSATNPAFLMTGLPFNYNMLDGSVGDASSMSVEFVNTSQTGITYPTS